MATRVVLQDTLTLSGDTSSGDVILIQPMDLWVPARGWGAATITTAVLDLSVTGTDVPEMNLTSIGDKSGPQRPVPDGGGSDIATIALNTGVGPDPPKSQMERALPRGSQIGSNLSR